MSSAVSEGAGDDLKVAVIVGLSHSGSTMLDLTLSAHPDIVGVGEIYNFARKHLAAVQDGGPKLCACGRDVGECELWCSVVDRVPRDATDDERIRRTYEELTVRFRALWPTGLMLDSSKKLESVDVLRTMPGVEVRVLFIVRDVRGWIASARDRRVDRYAGRAAGARGERWWRAGGRRLAKFRYTSPIALAWDWRAQNHRLLTELEARGVPLHVVGYERLCFSTDEVLSEIAEFLHVDAVDALSPAHSSSHMAAGNLVRLDADRRSRLSYDTRWMRRPTAVVPYVLSRRLRSFNDRFVWDEPATG